MSEFARVTWIKKYLERTPSQQSHTIYKKYTPQWLDSCVLMFSIRPMFWGTIVNSSHSSAPMLCIGKQYWSRLQWKSWIPECTIVLFSLPQLVSGHVRETQTFAGFVPSLTDNVISKPSLPDVWNMFPQSWPAKCINHFQIYSSRSKSSKSEKSLQILHNILIFSLQIPGFPFILPIELPRWVEAAEPTIRAWDGSYRWELPTRWLIHDRRWYIYI